MVRKYNTYYPFVPEKSPNRAKRNYCFHWKLKGDTALIFIWIAKWLFLNYLQGVNWDQSWTKNWNFVYIPCLFIRVFQNALNSICKTMRTTCGQNFSSIWSCLLELLLPNRSKWLQLGLKPKILSASSRYSQEQKVHKNWNLVSRTFRRMFLL